MKVFIAGPRAITKLDKPVEERLLNIYQKNITVIVGDANGIDKSIQQYFHKLAYTNVLVFASEGKARNNIGGRKVENVEVEKGVKGFDYFAAKDKAMAKKADYRFMIWNGKSKGTLNNIVNLINENKQSLVYFVQKKQFICIDNGDKLNYLISFSDDEAKVLYKKLTGNIYPNSTQISFFGISKDTL